ncbi:DUF1410 domain [Mesomycoplasma dispar]|uniref:DUF1410 domain n=1 Tax=Mesomycoplasma dispar TaxID=86660 RepID=A0AAJ5NLM6_9BACT|nr:fibronectin type III domain-containing protein [Mesomycoplasma dispar]AJR12580.1 hypothetical protein MDIS_02875 [Mesomycoplasma dispar]VEU62111.1 DUF1410 domain [Mesomycoplasma dispar]
MTDNSTTKKKKKRWEKSKKRALALSLLAFGGLSIGSFGLLPFLLKSWNTLQYNIVDFKHVNHNNASYEIEFALSDLDAYKLNYQDLNVDLTNDQEGKNVVVSHIANYDEFSRSWKINSNYTGLSFGKRYYLKVYLDDKKQKRFAAKKVIGFGQNVANFVDTPPAVSTINFQSKTPSTASVSVKFADEAANLEGKKVALEYYFVLKNQEDNLENKINNAQEIHTSYVDSATVKNGAAEFSLNNLHPGLDYKISAIRYVDSENRSEIPLQPMQKIPLDPKIDFEKDKSKKGLFETKTAKFRLIATTLVDQNLSYSQKRLTVNFANFDNTAIIQNKPITLNYKNVETGQKFSSKSFFSANLASFDLDKLDPGSTYQIESFNLESSTIEFSNTFSKNFYTPAAIIDSKIAVGATFADVELSVASADDLTDKKALLYLDDSSIVPASATFSKTDKNNVYKIKLQPKGLVNATKYALDKLIFASQIPNSVFATNHDGFDYRNVSWENDLEISSPKRNFVTKISDLKTFIKLEPKIYPTKVEYTFGFLLESSYLNDKNLYLYYYKKDEPGKLYKSKVARAQGSEIKFELSDFEVSSVYKLDKIEIENHPELAVKIEFDESKESAQKLKYDEFFIKFHVNKIEFENITETSAKAIVEIQGDFKNITKSGIKNQFSPKLVFGQPGFANLSKSISVNLDSSLTAGAGTTDQKNYEIKDNKLILYFKLDNLDPKTEYQVADLEIPEQTEFFSSSGILELNAKFTTEYQKVKIFGSNFDSITENSAIATIYFDPTFNSYLNGYKFKVKFKDEDGKTVSYPNEANNNTESYQKVENNQIKVSLTGLKPGQKYTFAGLEPAPGQNADGLNNLNFEYLVSETTNSQRQKFETAEDKAPYVYTTTDIASVQTNPQQDAASVTVNFTTKDPKFKERTNSTQKTAVIFVKNNATGGIASATAKIEFKDNSNSATFNLKELSKLTHHTITEILVDSQKIQFAENLKQENSEQRNFNTVATTATVEKVVQTEKKHNKIGLELSFDPIKDRFLEGDEIQVSLRNKKSSDKVITAKANVDQNLVLKLDFTENVEPGTEYEISKISDLTKDKNIQTSVGFEIKKAENYEPDLADPKKDDQKIYSAPELKEFSVSENKDETVKVKLTFNDAEKVLVKNNGNGGVNNQNLTLLLKNTKTEAIVTANGQAQEKDGTISAEFTFSNLDRNVKYELVSVNDYSKADSEIWYNKDTFTEGKKDFTVNVDKIEVKNLVFSEIKQNSVKAQIYFDPIRDSYLAEKEIEVEIGEDSDPVAQFVQVQGAVENSAPEMKKRVKITRLQDGRLVANLDFSGLKEGSDYKIKSLKLDKGAIQTNEDNKETGPKFEIVNEFSTADSVGQHRQIGEINDASKQKTLKFATDVVVSDVEINPNAAGAAQQDKQRSATIKVTFSNSNNEILKLKKDQVATITLINKATGKLVLTSANIQAEESTVGNKQTSASATFEFRNDLDKLTKYEISSIQVVRSNGIYSIPFSSTIQNDESKKSFTTQLDSITVKDISYTDISSTSVLLTTFFDSLEDNALNNRFEAELEYVLKGSQEVRKSSKVDISNNQATFTIEGLQEATGYEIKDLKLTKKSTPVRSTRSLTRIRRQAPEPIQNVTVKFDQTEVENKGKKDFATKSLISEVKIDSGLILKKPQNVQIANTNLSDTSAGIELKIKDPKKFFADYGTGKTKNGQQSQVRLIIKSNRTGAIAETGATITYDEGQSTATAKFSFENLEKYTIYNLVDIFINGVPVGFLNSLTEEQKQFHTTAKEVLPEFINQTEFKKHGAVVRMVFDVNKNWFLVGNKVKINFKKLGSQEPDDPELTAEAVVQNDGLAVFNINKENVKTKVPQGTRFEISKLEFEPETNSNQEIVKNFPLNKITGSDQVQVLSTSAGIQATRIRSRRDVVSLFAEGDAENQVENVANQFQTVQTQTGQNNFAAVNLRTEPLQSVGPGTQSLTKTFDTAAYITKVEKVNLAGTNGEIKITLSSTKLLEGAALAKMKLKYIDISDGQEHEANLTGIPALNSSTSEYTFSATNLKALNYYQLVSITYENQGQTVQTINFDEDQVSYQDRLFRTTPESFAVVDIKSTYNKTNKTANVKLQLDDQVTKYLEGYKVKISYKRQDEANNSIPTSTVEGVINSDGSVNVVLDDRYEQTTQQKNLILPTAPDTVKVVETTNTLQSNLGITPENQINNGRRSIDAEKLFEGFKYKIEKVELIQKPDASSGGRKKRSVQDQDLIEFNAGFTKEAKFEAKSSTPQTQGQQTFEESKKTIETIPISLYDQLIYTEEKDKSSGIDTKIYAYFISSDELQDQDKNHFKVQLYNKTLKKYETITKATSIKKINENNGKSHFYVVTFETNLNKASLYEIEHFVYKNQKIDQSEYKTPRVEKTEFTTPGKKAWLTNFSQIGAYEDDAATVYFQFDEKDEYLWRNKHKIELEIASEPNSALQQQTQVQTLKYTFVPEGSLTKVRIDKNSNKDQQNSSLEIKENTVYRITKFTIKEPETSASQGQANSPEQKNNKLKIDTVNQQNTVTPTNLGDGQMEVKKVESAEVVNFKPDQKDAFFETKAKFDYQEETNFIQNPDKNADGRSATLEFKFNDKFLQIPKKFATITVAKKASSSSSSSEEISFTSESEYNPTNQGKLTFKLENLDRFLTYEIKKLEIGGIEFESLRGKVIQSTQKDEFTPVTQKIYIADLKVEGLRTGNNESATEPQDGSKVFGKINVFFDKDDEWLNEANVNISIKDKNNKNTELAKIEGVKVTKNDQVPATPYNVEIDLNKDTNNKIQPGSKISLGFELKDTRKDINLKNKQPQDILIEIPENQYNLEYAPKIKSDIVIPPVIEDVIVTDLKDTSAKLIIKLKGHRENFNKLVENPVVLSIQPDPNSNTNGKIPIKLLQISKISTFKSENDQLKFELEYNLEDLIPNLEYKILKLKGQDLEIPFGELDYKLKTFAQHGSALEPLNKNLDSKIFKTTFTDLSPEKIIFTQNPHNSNSLRQQEYANENLNLNLDPISMWSLADKKIQVKLKPLNPDGTDIGNSSINGQEKVYEFDVKSDPSKKTLIASLDKKVTDEVNDSFLFPSTTYRISEISTKDINNPITLNLDKTRRDTKNLQFTTQLSQPILKEVKISNFTNKTGKEDGFEQQIYFKFEDPYNAIDETSMKDWKIILEGNNSNNNIDQWENVAKYEVQTENNIIALTNPRELQKPPFDYVEDPELQRILVEQKKLDERLNVINEQIKNKSKIINERTERLSKLSKTTNNQQFRDELNIENSTITRAIEEQKVEIEKEKQRIQSLDSYSKYDKKLNEHNKQIKEKNIRYFAFTLKGNASWLKFYKMRVAIQYKYFKNNKDRKNSVYGKFINNLNVNQTDNPNNKLNLSESEISKMQKIELLDFAKYTNRILLKKSVIKPLNAMGAYIEMEFDDPKNLLFNFDGGFPKANTKIDDLSVWTDLTSQAPAMIEEEIKNPYESKFKVDTTNDVGDISEPSNKWNITKNPFSRNTLPNLDFDVNAYRYNLTNPFNTLTENPHQTYIELLNKIPKSVSSQGPLILNTSQQKNYTLRLAMVERKNNTVKIGLIITYYFLEPSAFESKIFTIFPKILNPSISSNNPSNIDMSDYYKPLVPTLSKNVTLSFMSSPIVDKEDPYWGNFWANSSGNVWHTSKIRQYSSQKGQGHLIVDSFQDSLFQKIQSSNSNLWNYDYANNFFLGPTSPIKTLSNSSNVKPIGAVDNFAEQIRVRYGGGNRLIRDWLNDLLTRRGKSREPFGIKSTSYDPSSKIFTVNFHIPGTPRKIKEIMPTIAYAVFLEPSGKFYLFGNHNGNPLHFDRDLDLKTKEMKINLSPLSWAENELPSTGVNLNFVGIIVFPYLPTDITKNVFFHKTKGISFFSEHRHYIQKNFKKKYKYILPVENYEDLAVDAKNPYFVPWVSNENAWDRITY